MFGIFGKKKQETPMDVFIKAVYGDPPPPKRANLEQAIQLANGSLLMELIDKRDVVHLATQLDSGPIPYSTHDLALSVALNFFKRPEFIERLRAAQLMARMAMVEWLNAKKVAPLVAKSFEDTLYKLYK